MNEQQLAVERAAFESVVSYCDAHGIALDPDTVDGIVQAALSPYDCGHPTCHCEEGCDADRANDRHEAALAQREPVVDGEIADCVNYLHRAANVFANEGKMHHAADLLERTEAARLAAENRPCCPYGELIDATPENQRETMLHDALTERDELQAQLTAERARAEKLATDIHRILTTVFGVDAREKAILERIAAYQSGKENGQ